MGQASHGGCGISILRNIQEQVGHLWRWLRGLLGPDPKPRVTSACALELGSPSWLFDQLVCHRLPLNVDLMLNVILKHH